MKRAMIAAAAALALPLAALAQDMPTPKMLKGMEKGEWKTEILEHSESRKGQKMPAMTMCVDNLMKQAREQQAKSESKCTHKILKDASDEAVMEIKCPQRTVTTTMKRESPKSVLTEIKSAGDKPMTMKMRYTHLGPCRPGQAGVGYDKNSEQCQKIQASAAKMDPAKSCAGSGDKRAECESRMRQQIAQMKAMCN